MTARDVAAELRALDSLPCGQQLKVLRLYGDQPAVLEAVLDARRRGVSWHQLAAVLSRDGTKVSATAVRNYCVTQGVA